MGYTGYFVLITLLVFIISCRLGHEHKLLKPYLVYVDVIYYIFGVLGLLIVVIAVDDLREESSLKAELLAESLAVGELVVSPIEKKAIETKIINESNSVLKEYQSYLRGEDNQNRSNMTYANKKLDDPQPALIATFYSNTFYEKRTIQNVCFATKDMRLNLFARYYEKLHPELIILSSSVQDIARKCRKYASWEGSRPFEALKNLNAVSKRLIEHNTNKIDGKKVSFVGAASNVIKEYLWPYILLMALAAKLTKSIAVLKSSGKLKWL